MLVHWMLFCVFLTSAYGKIVWINNMDGLRLKEELPQGSLVYTLLAVDEATSSSQGILYGFNNKAGNNLELDAQSPIFRINETSGEVRTWGTVLDYEVQDDLQTVFTQYLMAKKDDDSDFARFRANVRLININDNAPTFSDTAKLFVNESDTVPNGRFLLFEGITATDNENIVNTLSTVLEMTIIGCRYPVSNRSDTDCDGTFKLEQTMFSSKEYVGNLYQVKPMDFETHSLIHIILEATDGELSSTKSFVVTVENQQDLPPFWSAVPFNSRTNEHNQTFKVQVKAVDGDGLGRPVSYFLPPGQTNNGKSVNEVFQIDEMTGVITGKIELDLEDTEYFRQYNPEVLRDEWKLTLMACEIESSVPDIVLSNQCTDPETITIFISDINDNAPLHQTNLYRYKLFENEPNGRVLTTPRIDIFDRDTEAYNKFRTEFLEPNAEFEITGAERNPIISIKNTSLIDMDAGPRVYQFILRTFDIADNSLSSTATVRVEIDDRNDNKPYFLVPNYSAGVREDAKEKDPVTTVVAYDIDYDADLHGNRSIQYALLGAYSELFSINSKSGVVTVGPCPLSPNGKHGKHPCIDYDIDPREYNLDVQAIDNNGGIVARFSTVPLIITVLEVNDNVPEVPDYIRDIRENLTSFEPQLFVQGTDKDDVGGISSLSYSIQSQAPGQFWTINPRTGEITVNKPNNAGIKFTDGDVDGEFILEVQVTDGLNSVVSNVRIRVLDENDNAPRFVEEIFRFSISELTPGGVSIYQITAIDADDPTTDNGKLEYSIFRGNIGGKFRLNQSTGDIFTTDGATFDFDTLSTYTLTAIVNDKGTPQLQGQCLVVITIIDENNKNPVVDPPRQGFAVYENPDETAPPGTVSSWSSLFTDALLNHIVGTITARDPDVNAELRFEFIDPRRALSSTGVDVDRNTYDYTTLFTLDPVTGVIRVNANLSSDITRDLFFDVMVTDITPSPSQTGRGSVTIDVLPYNQDPPVIQPFISPVYLPEEQPSGSIVISLIARDNNGIAMYELIEHPDDFFMITRTTGTVNIKNKVDYDNPIREVNSSSFVVRVTDTGVPVLTSTASVDVIFYNINDEDPYFVNVGNLEPQDIYFGEIDENSPDGTAVTIVKALDKDRPDQNGFHEVRYFMDDNRFEVDNITGAITVRLRNGFELDREQNNRILTIVRARDNPKDVTNQNSAAATVQVRLRDVNDNPPIFSDDVYEVTVFETISTTTDILQVFTTDNDIGNHAISVYNKVSGRGDDREDLFGIRYESGRIFVDKSLIGKSRRNPYTFWVQAQDNLGTGFITEVKVLVYVKEAANSPPRWIIPAEANMTIFVLESQYNGMLVYDVKAVDDDSGSNGVLDYSLIYDGQTTQTTPEFEINRVNGMIHAQIVFDRETTDSYVLLLKATDRGQTPLQATRFLTIVVKDVNDNAPIFPTNELEFRVPEDAPRTHFIGQVEATDADLNPIIIYEIISGNEEGVFALDRSTGVISLAETLDSERKSVYYLDIRARNEDPDYTVIRNRRRRAIDPSIITVKILVGDINDLAPVFLQSEYYGCVSTRSPYDKHILTIQAKDYDAVGSGIVRYRVVDGNRQNGQLLFDIHPKFGVLSNKVLMRNYADSVFSVIVNARDGESIEDSESANVTARVFVTLPGKEVKLLITQNTGEVRLYQSQIQSIIEEAADLDYLCINEIEDHVTESRGSVATLWSDVYVSGVRRNSNGELVIVSGVELRNIISREINDRRQDFDLLYIRDVELASSSDEIKLKDKAVLIILIIIAVLIFLVIIFCIVAFMCIQAAKKQKKQILIHKTHATAAPIMIVQQEPEPVVYDNRQYVQEIPVKQPEHEPVVVSTFQERVYDPEPVVVSTFQEERVYEPEPVHVQYAVVQKRSTSLPEDDTDAIVVELKDDEPRQADVYEPEYRIEAELEEQ